MHNLCLTNIPPKLYPRRLKLAFTNNFQERRAAEAIINVAKNNLTQNIP